MKYQIMVEMLFMLLARKKVTAREFAQRFSISKRTVFRYLDELSLACIPVMCDRGANGGYYLAESYKLPASFLTEKEFDALVSAINAVGSELGASEVLSTVKDKLFSAVKKEDSTPLTSSSLIIDSSGWNGIGGNKNKIRVFEKAIKNNLLVKTAYHDRSGEKTERIIEPHALVLKQGLWYVFAFCRLRQDFRLFKISRVEYATTLSETFTRREFDPNNLPFNDWYTSQSRTEIIFELDESIRSEIEDWLGIESVKTVGDKLIAEARLPYDKGLVTEIAKYGDKVRVLKPEKLKKELIASARELLAFYGVTNKTQKRKSKK